MAIPFFFHESKPLTKHFLNNNSIKQFNYSILLYKFVFKDFKFRISITIKANTIVLKSNVTFTS